MSDEQQVVEQLEAPVQEEFIYRYQPKDDEGRPLGGEQVIKASDAQDALDKMAQQNAQLIQLNRRLKRDAAIGLSSDDQIPADAPRTRHEITEFKARQLTPEEKWEITRGMNDPDRFDEAADKLLEAKLGAKPEAIRQTLTQAQEDIAGMRAQQEARAFVESNPDYYPCDENLKTMAGWMIKNGLQPTKANFEFSYRRLTDAGLLLSAPIASEDSQSNTQTEPETDTRIGAQEPTTTKRPAVISSGLSKANSSNVGGSGIRRGYSEDEIANMTPQEYDMKVRQPLLRQLASRR